jgi:hypothetical protein
MEAVAQELFLEKGKSPPGKGGKSHLRAGEYLNLWKNCDIITENGGSA